MKYTLTLALLLLAATGGGETNYEVYVQKDGAYIVEIVSGQTNDIIMSTSPPPVAVVGYVTNSSRLKISAEATEQIVKRLAASGEICEVFGHCWEPDWADAFHAIYNPEGQRQSRKCRICGKVETKTEVWK